jgi:3-phenylpropionate/trans-cinnamate dioxygenase ferredoxin reductase subunit
MPQRVVVGAGQAGAGRREPAPADSPAITLLGEEPHLPYQRPPLSKGI